MPYPQSIPRDVRFIRFASLAAGTAGAMYGEFTLAVQTGMHPAVAWTYPIALDLYAYVAFRLHRRNDIGCALGLMAVSQGLSHLIGSYMISAGWPVVVLVWAIILPVVLWRTHHVGSVPTMPAETSESVEPTVEPQEQPEVEPEQETEDAPEKESVDELAPRRRWTQESAYAYIVDQLERNPALSSTAGKARLGRAMGFTSGARRVNQILAKGSAA